MLTGYFSDFWYEYEPVRHCTPDKPNCDSKYLFCDKKNWRCRSRIQLGGNCTGFAFTDICYKSFCIQGLCRIPATEGNGFERKEKKQSGVVWAKTLMLTDDDQPLTSGIAHILVKDEAGNEALAYIQKSTEYPEVPGQVYLPLPHPREGLSYNVSLEARDHYGRYCQSYCFNETVERYQVCEPKLVMKARPDSTSSNISFTHSSNSKRFLDMDLSTHPSQWSVRTPFMVFACHRKMIDSAQIVSISEQVKPIIDNTEYVWFRVNVMKKANSVVDIDESEVKFPYVIKLINSQSFRSKFKTWMTHQICGYLPFEEHDRLTIKASFLSEHGTHLSSNEVLRSKYPFAMAKNG